LITPHYLLHRIAAATKEVMTRYFPIPIKHHLMRTAKPGAADGSQVGHVGGASSLCSMTEFLLAIRTEMTPKAPYVVEGEMEGIAAGHCSARIPLHQSPLWRSLVAQHVLIAGERAIRTYNTTRSRYHGPLHL
jgi:hypothetical protein